MQPVIYAAAVLIRIITTYVYPMYKHMYDVENSSKYAARPIGLLRLVTMYAIDV